MGEKTYFHIDFPLVLAAISAIDWRFARWNVRKKNLLGVSIDWFYCRENRMKKTFDWLALEKHSFSAMFLTLFLSKLQYKLNKANQVQRNRRMLRSNSTKLSNQSNQWVYSVTNLIRVRLWSILVSHSSVLSFQFSICLPV